MSPRSHRNILFRAKFMLCFHVKVMLLSCKVHVGQSIAHIFTLHGDLVQQSFVLEGAFQINEHNFC